jgi:hypothetical protein
VVSSIGEKHREDGSMRQNAHRLLVCVVVPTLLVAALASCSIVAPSGGAGSATEIDRQIGDTSYLGLAEWDRLVTAARLLAPLFVAYTDLDQWRPIARASGRRE